MSQQQSRERVEDVLRTVQSNGEVTLPKEWRDRAEPKFVEISEQDDGSLLIEPVP